MVRRGRSSLRSSTRARRSPSPKVDEDEPMEDVAPEESQAESPAKSQDVEKGEEDAQSAEADEEEPNITQQSSDHEEDASNPSTPRVTQPRRGRGRGRGRARTSLRRVSLNSTPDPVGEDGSDNATPRRGRGRGRAPGTRGGFRGRGRGANRGPSHVTRVPIDKEGNMMDVIEDEVVQPEDPEGETKVDKFGNLQGGREYRVRTFTIAGRGERLYMLSTEPARCTGFRDSYLFFNKHMTLFKIIIDDDEKRDLIEREVIPHSYKGRAIGVVTARSVFREFGSKIIVGGKKVTDDYQEAKARERGDIEGELVDPFDKIPEAGQKYNRNQYVAWHGASSVYHTQPPNAQAPGRVPFMPSKKKTTITSANWMHEHALAASTFNTALKHFRKRAFDGVYDPHTNLMCYPSAAQPTHARWERVPSPSASAPPPKKPKLAMTNGDSTLAHSGSYDQHQPNGVHYDALPNGKINNDDDDYDGSDNESDIFPASYPSHTLVDRSKPVSAAPKHMSTPFDQPFAPPSQFLKKNYLIIDTHFSTPPSSLFNLPSSPQEQSAPSAHRPTPEANPQQTQSSQDSHVALSSLSNHDFSAGRPPHLGIPRLSESQMEDVELPEECREAIREARRQENKWRSKWAGFEVTDGIRGPLRLGVGI